ncbi:MAG TPA: hypothetical protein VFM35_07000 [Candidatus Binatia bacterium]|nr:hypothetical protein [Candidatus Binatia bacterium]
MTARRDDSFRAEFERFQAAQRSARETTSQVLGQARSKLLKHALLQRQRAARKAIEEALGKRYGARGAREIAFHLSEWFEEAAFLAALHLDPKRFTKAEIEAGVTGVLANVLNPIWEAARTAGVPLPCLEDEKPDNDDEDI